MMREGGVKLLLAAALLLGLASPAFAEVRILASPGGEVGPFLDLFEGVRNSGERVVIDGPCLSACTLVLSIVPSNRICVTRRAVLGFHAARSIDQRGHIYAEPAGFRGCAGGLSAAGATLDENATADCRRTCYCCAGANSRRSIIPAAKA